MYINNNFKYNLEFVFVTIVGRKYINDAFRTWFAAGFSVHSYYIEQGKDRLGLV